MKKLLFLLLLIFSLPGFAQPNSKALKLNFYNFTASENVKIFVSNVNLRASCISGYEKLPRTSMPYSSAGYPFTINYTSDKENCSKHGAYLSFQLYYCITKKDNCIGAISRAGPVFTFSATPTKSWFDSATMKANTGVTTFTYQNKKYQFNLIPQQGIPPSFNITLIVVN